ncbi:MAG: hypothetical protein LBI18_07860 [Planctomycetaceae bacterium]|jgi:tetratricopeptide (TPR) repeat protein|nr:hypothetical protein [Planctomycetaceae bacterium]
MKISLKNITKNISSFQPTIFQMKSLNIVSLSIHTLRSICCKEKVICHILVVALIFVLVLSNLVFATDFSTLAIQAVEASKKLPDNVKKQILDVVKVSPNSNRWSGSAEKLMFGVAVTKFDDDDDSDDKKLVRQNAHLTALQEMLFARPLYESYMEKDKRLKEYNFVRDAVKQVAETLHAKAEITYIVDETPQISNGFVSITAVDKRETLIQFMDAAPLKVVQKAYAGILHVKAKQELAKKDYQAALNYLKETIPLGGLNVLLQLDAFRCFCALDNFEEAKQFAEQLSKDEIYVAKLFGAASGFDTPAAKKIREQLEIKIHETENDMLLKEYFGK